MFLSSDLSVWLKRDLERYILLINDYPGLCPNVKNLSIWEKIFF